MDRLHPRMQSAWYAFECFTHPCTPLPPLAPFHDTPPPSNIARKSKDKRGLMSALGDINRLLRENGDGFSEREYVGAEPEPSSSAARRRPVPRSK